MILLCGKSGSGKSTFVKSSRMKEVISHTTRLPRAGEINGVDKWFHEWKYGAKGVIAETFFNGFHYWVTEDDLVDKDVFIVDIKGIQFMQQLYKNTFDENFKVWYITCNPITRLYRLIKRDGYKKAISRFIHDVKAFKDISKIEHSTIKFKLGK